MATSFKIDGKLEERIRQIASQRDASPHGIMLEAIEQYAEREEARQSFKEEATAAWTAYKENGRHLTGRQVNAWLSGWGTDNEKPVPDCHE
jgi:predicted transcriptional regulator